MGDSPPPPSSPPPAYDADLKAAFASMDAQGTGKITKEQLLQGLKEQGVDITLEQVYMAVVGVDLDGDGMLDYSEFQLFVSGEAPSAEQIALKLFRQADTDCSGTITATELRDSLQGQQYSNMEAMEKAMKAADTNGDGQIDYAEFKKLLETVG
mmetsp:Transcript_32286/g.66794  ORF Transcript_32286/g.66794 Transcript_32286/m.66794 type:complete len:154 (-) Transcript_32286:68-529(-)